MSKTIFGFTVCTPLTVTFILLPIGINYFFPLPSSLPTHSFPSLTSFPPLSPSLVPSILTSSLIHVITLHQALPSPFTIDYFCFQEQLKSKRLEDSMFRLDAEMRKTDQLLYQMIPKSVADRLRSGEPSVSTCEVGPRTRTLSTSQSLVSHTVSHRMYLCLRCLTSAPFSSVTLLVSPISAQPSRQCRS